MFNWIETGLDTCKYTVDGITTTAIIEEITPKFITVKPISRMGNNVYESNLDRTFIPQTFWHNNYDEIQLEIWMDGRGCDNSAIGVQGWYESHRYFDWEIENIA
jgi:hypothetical protein